MLLNVISGNLAYYWFKIMKSDLVTYFICIFFVHKFGISFYFDSGVMSNELRKVT